MKSLLLAAGVAAPFVLASSSTAGAAPKIDPRGVALLDGEIARLKAFKSFRVEGVETLRFAGGTRTAKVRLSLQRPLRAALDVKVVQPDGRVVRGDAVLVGDKAALTFLAGAPATTALLYTQEGRQEVTSSLYDLDSLKWPR